VAFEWASRLHHAKDHKQRCTSLGGKRVRPVRIIHRRRKLFGEVAAGLLALLQEGGNEVRAEDPAAVEVLG
jgi:hypothetical protein